MCSSIPTLLPKLQASKICKEPYHYSCTRLGPEALLWFGRKDHVSEEREGAVQAGIDHKESSGRQMTRAMGLHKGMESDGIFPNEQASKKLGEFLKGDEGKSKK